VQDGNAERDWGKDYLRKTWVYTCIQYYTNAVCIRGSVFEFRKFGGLDCPRVGGWLLQRTASGEESQLDCIFVCVGGVMGVPRME